jgi:hypothetical protein
MVSLLGFAVEIFLVFPDYALFSPKLCTVEQNKLPHFDVRCFGSLLEIIELKDLMLIFTQ